MALRFLFALIAGFLVPAAASAACEGRLVDSPHVMPSPACVPDKPQRIASLDAGYTLGMAIELGLPVAGAPLVGMSDEALREKAQSLSVENLGSLTEPSIEKIIGLQPDLILGSGFLGENALALASRVAPAAFITAENWKDYLRALIELSGSDKKAEEVLADYESRVARLRDEIPEDLTVSVVRITSWDFQVYLDAPNAYAPFAVLREAGVRRTAYETSDGIETLKRPDWEQLGQLDGDVLLYIVGGTNTSDTDGRLEEVLGNPLWQQLPAVRAGRVYRVDPATWMEFSGVGSAHKVLDDIERYIVREQ